mmetsp:Transcript_123046/g.262549  ORF Transcript_123046/g.262549 Transcript_123046/m.262549 type:complete len:494 (-) Transcript_123046:162-1643(-)
MVAARAEGLLAAEERDIGGRRGEVRFVARVHKIPEELPSGGRHEARDLLLLRHKVQGTGRGHGAGAPFEATLEEGNDAGVGADDGKAVRGAHEPLLAEDHVPVGVAIGCGAEIRDARSVAHLLASLVRSHRLDQLHGMSEVGVRVAVRRRVLAAEVFLRHRVHEARLRCAELSAKDALGIGTLHTVHGVVYEAEVLPSDQLLDRFHVENLAEEAHVVIGAIEDIYTDLALDQVGLCLADVDGREALADLILLDLLRVGEDLLRDLLGRRATVLAIELDPEVLVDAAGVVRGRKDEAAEGSEAALAVANDSAGGRSAQEPIRANPNCLHPVRDGHLDDHLDGVLVPVAAIAAHNHGAAGDMHTACHERIKGALHKVLEVVLPHENLRLLPKPRGARLLPLDGGCRLRGDLKAAAQSRLRTGPLKDHSDVRRPFQRTRHCRPFRLDGRHRRKTLLGEGARNERRGTDRVPQRREGHRVNGRLGRLIILCRHPLQE